MIIVIDGYNLLKAIFPRVKGKLDKQRDQLIRQLGFYRRQKAETIKQIVLVFDGGRVGNATREIREGIVVVFSGQRQSADDWIIDFVARNKEKELMLVTRDREIIEKCRRHNVEVLKVFDFYDIMQKRLLEGVGEDLQKKTDGDGIQKYEREDDEITEIEGVASRHSGALDLLMEQAALDFYEKEADWPEHVLEEQQQRKGNSKTLSKKEKKRKKKLEKL